MRISATRSGQHPHCEADSQQSVWGPVRQRAGGWRCRYLEQYVEHIVGEGRQVTLVLSVGYWVWFPEVPADYLDFLDALSRRAVKVVVLSIPTVHVTAHTGRQARPLTARPDVAHA